MKFDNIPEAIKYLATQLTDVNCNVHNRGVYAVQMRSASATVSSKIELPKEQYEFYLVLL